jgi:hypothetical protein
MGAGRADRASNSPRDRSINPPVYNPQYDRALLLWGKSAKGRRQWVGNISLDWSVRLRLILMRGSLQQNGQGGLGHQPLVALKAIVAPAHRPQLVQED